MDIEEFKQILSLGHELQRVEFKPPFSLCDKEMLAKVVRAIISMANTRDGGKIIIGIEEKDKVINLIGLSKPQVDSLNYDDLSANINEYVDPSIEFNSQVIEFRDKVFLILSVNEFLHIPVLCKKEFNFVQKNNTSQVVLRKGACYVRTKVKPESAEIPTQTEMRELLDLATIKGIRKFVNQINDSNILIVGKEVDQYEKQYEEQLATTRILDTDSPFIGSLNKLGERGYWEFCIKPNVFINKRIPNVLDLREILMKTKVDFMGWYFPYVDQHNQPIINHDSIIQVTEWNHHIESWRFFQSGLFYDKYAISEDWRDQSTFSPAPPDWEPGKLIGMNDIVIMLYRYYEFASRLSMEIQDCDSLEISIFINGIKGRRLYQDNPRKWGFDFNYTSTVNDYLIRKKINRDDLIANTNDLVFNKSIEIFSMFGYKVNTESVKTMFEGYSSLVN